MMSRLHRAKCRLQKTVIKCCVIVAITAAASGCFEQPYIARNSDSFVEGMKLSRNSFEYLAASAFRVFALSDTNPQSTLGPAPRELYKAADNEVVITVYAADGGYRRAVGSGNGNPGANAFAAIGILAPAASEIASSCTTIRIDIVNRKNARPVSMKLIASDIEQFQSFVVYRSDSEAYFLPGDWAYAQKNFGDTASGSNLAIIAGHLGLTIRQIKDQQLLFYPIDSQYFTRPCH